MAIGKLVAVFGEFQILEHLSMQATLYHVISKAPLGFMDISVTSRVRILPTPHWIHAISHLPPTRLDTTP